MATKWYVEQVLDAGCAFVNCIPVFIAREEYWQKRFQDRGLPIIGDDIKSQVGATITHRVLTRLFADRGVRIDRTYQLNFGGNTDFLNMLERERLESKKISKTNAVTSQLDYDDRRRRTSTSARRDYVPWLEDRKWCHIRMEGTTFGDVPLNMELKLEVWDSPELGRRRDRRGPLRQAGARTTASAARCWRPSSYFMKSPPVQYHDDDRPQPRSKRSSTRTLARKPSAKPAPAEAPESRCISGQFKEAGPITGLFFASLARPCAGKLRVDNRHNMVKFMCNGARASARKDYPQLDDNFGAVRLANIETEMRASAISIMR